MAVFAVYNIVLAGEEEIVRCGQKRESGAVRTLRRKLRGYARARPAKESVSLAETNEHYYCSGVRTM